MPIDKTAPIIPGESVGGLRLGSKLDLTQWSETGEDFPWEFSWVDHDVPKQRMLRPFTDRDKSVIAFVDGNFIVVGLYATPNYMGSLYGCIRTGMIAGQAKLLLPALEYSSINASLVHPEEIGFMLKHEEDDLDEEVFLGEPFAYIGVFSGTDGYFL